MNKVDFIIGKKKSKIEKENLRGKITFLWN